MLSTKWPLRFENNPSFLRKIPAAGGNQKADRCPAIYPGSGKIPVRKLDDLCLFVYKINIANEYKLTESERTRDNLKEAMEDSNNIAQFLESDGYIRLEEGTVARSVHLYAAYKRWCKDNLENPVATRSFSQYLRDNQVKYGIEYTKHALDNQRGFRHILVLIDPNKSGALDGAYFEEQENQAPYAPFLP